MESDSSLLISFLLLVLLILASAFFTMSEIAIITLNDAKLRKQAQEGNKKAVLLVRLVDEPSRFLATIQVGAKIAGLFAAAITAQAFVPYWAGVLHALPITEQALRTFCLVILTLVLAFLNLVCGELVPKRIGMQYCEKIAFAAALPLTIVYKLERPFVVLISATANGLLRVLGINPHEQPDTVTEEEIRMMIDVGNESGQIEEGDKDMINNIFELDDHSVDEMMTHRTEIVAVENTESLEEVIRTVTQSGYSRIPVYEDDLDTIVGILYVKDLLGLVTFCGEEPFDFKQYMREPLYVLESTNCKSLLKELKEKKIQMAIVVDEYGGTSGLVTMEDLLESIVGNIQDEYDDEEEEVAALSENVYLVEGLASLEDMAKLFNFTVSDEEEEECDTIGGYIISLLGYIPAEEEHPSVQTGSLRFTVEEMDERRIAKLRVEKLTPPVGEDTKATAEPQNKK